MKAVRSLYKCPLQSWEE